MENKQSANGNSLRTDCSPVVKRNQCRLSIEKATRMGANHATASTSSIQGLSDCVMTRDEQLHYFHPTKLHVSVSVLETVVEVDGA